MTTVRRVIDRFCCTRSMEVSAFASCLWGLERPRITPTDRWNPKLPTVRRGADRSVEPEDAGAGEHEPRGHAR